MKPNKKSGVDISDWRPEDEQFWENTGKKIAYRNLWISVPALLCGFAIWGMWGIITVQMLNLGFPFTQAELFSLTAIAGLAGATMRPNFAAQAGGAVGYRCGVATSRVALVELSAHGAVVGGWWW